MMRKIIGKFLTGLSIVLLAWLLASYIEIASNNLKENPTYSSYNSIIFLTGLFTESDA